MKKNSTKQMVVTAMLCALAYVSVICTRIPISSMDFLRFEPKDVIITIGGYIYGPLTAICIAVITAVIEFFTISTTGVIGLVMNIISSAAFSCTAVAIYRKRRSFSNAVIGLCVAVVTMVVAMILWNYCITPLYMGIPRTQIATMLLPVFLPFNTLKGVINATLIMLLYKPMTEVLRKAKLLNTTSPVAKRKLGIGNFIVCCLVLTTCILIILAIKGIL